MPPFVSVLTPTYNRRKFITSLIQCYKSQTYPLTQMEWIIIDDGEDSVEDIFTGPLVKGIPNVRYIRISTGKMPIGAKRNMLNKEAKGDIMVAMDDDDFYFPDRVRTVVTAFQANPKIELAGASEIYMFFTDIKKIYRVGPYGKSHATNGTMAWRRSYALTRSYNSEAVKAEEREYLENYKNPMIQLDPFKVMLVISHSENTHDKVKMRENNPALQATTMPIKAFIKDKTLRDFYSNA
jgi:glycosyltransferase involved in cell wall biosynthesis